MFDVQDVNKITKVQESTIIKEGNFPNGITLIEEEKIVIMASESIDLIDYSNINDPKVIFSSNFEGNVFEPLGLDITMDKKLLVIGNDSKLIFVDSSNFKDITLIKVLDVGNSSEYIMSIKINKS